MRPGLTAVLKRRYPGIIGRPVASSSEVSPESTPSVAQDWARRAGRKGNWAEASQAWDYALRAMQVLFHGQTARGHQEIFLRGLDTVPVEAAQAAARAGDPVTAVVALERGRTMLLSESLSRELADIDEMEREGYPGEAARFRRAAAVVGRLQAETAAMTRGLFGVAENTGFRLSQLHAARGEYHAAVAAIQALPGHDGFLRPVSYEDIKRASRATPIVYLVPARREGMALRVTPDGDPLVMLLPGLRNVTVDVWVSKFVTAYRGRAADARAWSEQLDETCRYLGAAVLGPCFDSGLITDKAVLVPTGRLALLPLHAAWRHDDTAPNGRRYALDQALLTYAPSAQAVAAAQTRASRAQADSVLAVADPAPVTVPPLPGTVAEAVAAMRFFPAGRFLSGMAATREAVLALLPGLQVHHFACHAKADTASPLDSALLLANNEHLSISDIMKLTLPHPRLSFLSACETAVIGEQLPEEVIGLHTALMQVGVPGVVGLAMGGGG